MTIKKTRILLTGGGSGGHIYPLIAVADAILEKKLQGLSLYYMGPTGGFDEEFIKRDIGISRIVGGKLRRYFDLMNFIDIPKFAISVLQAIAKMYFIMPDVVFSKGGTGALAVVLAARFYFIPVIIHESDSVPGLTNRISGKFAKRIAIAFEGAAGYFSPKKTALVGNPVRKELFEGSMRQTEAKTQLKFEQNMPLLLVLGGSQGAQRLNSLILDNLSELLEEMQIYHQVGLKNVAEAQETANIILRGFPETLRTRYRMAGFLDVSSLRLAMNAADVVLSRTGASAIYELSALGKPSILIPLGESAGDHQRGNAYEYAKTGAAAVIEEKNLTIHIFLREVKRIVSEVGVASRMSEAAKGFFKPDAANTIANEVLKLAKAA